MRIPWCIKWKFYGSYGRHPDIELVPIVNYELVVSYDVITIYTPVAVGGMGDVRLEDELQISGLASWNLHLDLGITLMEISLTMYS